MARLARDHGGPVVTAVILALLAVLPTTATIFTSSGAALSIDDVERLIPSPGETLVVVVVTLLLTAVASGLVGGLIRRRFRVTGAAVALVFAWLVGALLLPVVTAVLGLKLQTAVMCFDTCSAMLDASQPTAGLLGVLVGMVLLVVTVVGAIVPLLLAVLAIVFARRGHPTLAIACLALGFGILNLLAFLFVAGAIVPYVCLAVGVVAWSRWLDVRAAGARPPVDAAQPAPVESAS